MDLETKQLSDRERTVLLLAAEGLTDKEIAKHLDLSQRTIGTYWERMRTKLGPSSRTQLVARFLRTDVDSNHTDQGYRDLFSSSEDGVLIFSPDGQIIYANPSIAALLGQPLDRVMAARVPQLFQSSEVADLREFVLGLSRAHRSQEFAVNRGNGGKVWLALRGGPITDRRGQKAAAVLMVRDVTAQRRVAFTLDSCQQSLSFLAEHCSDAVLRFDASLTCVTANPAFCALNCVEAKAVEGKSVDQLMRAGYLAGPWKTALEEALQTGKSSSFTSTWKGGSVGQTHLATEPGMSFLPTGILSITRLA